MEYSRTKPLSFRISNQVLDEIGFPIDFLVVVDHSIRLLRLADQFFDSFYGYFAFLHYGRVR